MDYLEIYSQNLQRLASPENIQKEVLKEIEAEKEKILDYVRSRWKVGLRPSGNIIGTYRSEEYRREKLALNSKAGGNVDLTLTGDLKAGLTLNKVLDSGFSIFSDDYKAQHIAQKYGLDVYGLTDEEIEEVFEIVGGRVLVNIFNQIL